jgi:hypothetical protein
MRNEYYVDNQPRRNFEPLSYASILTTVIVLEPKRNRCAIVCVSCEPEMMEAWSGRAV